MSGKPTQVQLLWEGLNLIERVQIELKIKRKNLLLNLE